MLCGGSAAINIAPPYSDTLTVSLRMDSTCDNTSYYMTYRSANNGTTRMLTKYENGDYAMNE